MQNYRVQKHLHCLFHTECFNAKDKARGSTLRLEHQGTEICCGAIKSLVDLFFRHLLQLSTMNGHFLLQFYVTLHSSHGFP